MADYAGPSDLVIRSGLQLIRLSISNRNEIMARPDFADTWKTMRVLTLIAHPTTGTYVRHRAGTRMLDVTGLWNKQYREKYGE